MPRNELGNIRRSQILTGAGPGAIVDFRTEKGPVSAVTLSLEKWPPGTVIHEERLEKRLNIKELRMPPVVLDTKPPRGEPVPATLFPLWLQCPNCSLLQTSWPHEPGEASRYCPDCSADQPRKTYVIPAPFVAACELGHLDDFPWDYWIDHRPGCQRRRKYWLKSEGGAGLSGLTLRCIDCKADGSMEGAFNPDALKRFGKCNGSRPWLRELPNEVCTMERKTLQRGSSSMYFPVLASALDIPPWSDGLQKRLRQYWDDIMKSPEADIRALLKIIERTKALELTGENLVREVLARKQRLEGASAEAFLSDEYKQLAADIELSRDEQSEFEIRVEQVPAELKPWVRRLVRVVRLREVRVLRAFTRIRFPDPETPDYVPAWAPLSATRLEWLPAVENRGEGIFLELDAERLYFWSEKFQSRASGINDQWLRDWEERHKDRIARGEKIPPPRSVTPKMLLVHSLAHALIRQLSLDCGYSAASLRERLYVDGDCAGLLIYTAAPDSDGTLGGLSRQGTAARMVSVLEGALASQRWCSSDPLCAMGAHAFSEKASGAACHSCLLVSETSCEEFNRMLDRAALVGMPHDSSLSYFHGSILLS